MGQIAAWNVLKLDFWKVRCTVLDVLKRKDFAYVNLPMVLYAKSEVKLVRHISCALGPVVKIWEG